MSWISFLISFLCLVSLYNFMANPVVKGSQAENSEITETTEITEKPVKQSNCIVYQHKIEK